MLTAMTGKGRSEIFDDAFKGSAITRYRLNSMKYNKRDYNFVFACLRTESSLVATVIYHAYQSSF